MFILWLDLSYMCLISRSAISDSLRPCETVVHQTPLSLGFPRQAHWSGLPFPSPGDLPDPGLEPTLPALAGRFFTTKPPELYIFWEENHRVKVPFYHFVISVVFIAALFTIAKIWEQPKGQS